MPRQPRLDAPGTLHHVIGRGIEGCKIFRTNVDRKSFVDRLDELCTDRLLMIYAWALMPNHFHLLARTGIQPLSKSMKQLLTGYVVNFNRRHGRYGHLFQNRYKSIVCEDDPYLLELTRYIHLNPLRAGMVKDLAALSTYPWSGHSAIMGAVARPWQDTGTVLAYFGDNRGEAAGRYEAFVREGIALGSRPDLVGGGLIRSTGGWSQVMSARRKGLRPASDERILGSSDFVSSLLSDAEKKERETLRLSLKMPDLSALAKRVTEGEGLEASDLRSGRRRKDISRARRVFCQLAVGKMRYPGAEVARFLGLSTSAVNRLANSKEVLGIERYL